jgi:NAD(P)-dependent dehydrogenase (short-subunit alcohol dehydrogenase family)
MILSENLRHTPETEVRMLHGKRVIVTGAATGIGRATAIMAAARGARVAAFDVNDRDAATMIEEAERAGGIVRSWHVDVADEPQVRVAVADATDWLGGPPDALLHSAGILLGAGVDLEAFDEATWDSVIDVNLKGSFLVSKHVAPAMRAAGSGSIVLVASGAGVIGGSSSYAYGSSKGGVHGLAMVLRAKLEGTGVRVYDVAPGQVATPLKIRAAEELFAHDGDRANLESTMAKLVKPEGIAEVLVWLASDASADVTGTIFTR